ncbi:MAG: acyl-CoA thioesterase [Deltaproteobacteria bacterium]|nr:acyl-CoA thioesterase [Deltaproteobacteria bacterium]
MSSSQSPNHVYSIVIKEHHLDTFGHVNNATYLQIFEEARWEWITGNGYGLDVVKSTGLGPVILELKAIFRKELTLRSRITINTFVTEARSKLCRVRQEMQGSDGVIYCDAEFLFGLFDTKARKLVAPTDKWLKAIGQNA